MLLEARSLGEEQQLSGAYWSPRSSPKISWSKPSIPLDSWELLPLFGFRYIYCDRRFGCCARDSIYGYDGSCHSWLATRATSFRYRLIPMLGGGSTGCSSHCLQLPSTS